MSRPLIIGAANPYVGRRAFVEALYPVPEASAGGRLWRMLHDVSGLSRERYLTVFERTNLNEPDFRAKLDAAERVVCLGARVWKALALPVETPLLTGCVDTYGPTVYWRVPHPSGRNRQLNDPEMRRRVGELLRDLIQQGCNPIGGE